MTSNQAAGPVLVTGAAGFIGSHVAEALLARGDAVVGLDNFDPFYPRAIKSRTLHELIGLSRFSFVEGDLTDRATVRHLMQTHRPRAVVHLAAKAGVRPSIADPAGYMHANVTGTAVILQEAHLAGCDRVVVASSSSVYGNSPHPPFAETLDVSEPISPYAASKRACELLGFTHWKLTGQPVAMLRFFTVFGPRQRPDLAISHFLQAALDRRPIQMFGDGSMSRDFTYVADIVAGVLASLDQIPSYGYRVWNLGGNRPVSLRTMIDTVGRVAGRPLEITPAPMQPGDVQTTWADLTRTAAELGYNPSTDFESGVTRQFAWMTRSQHA